MNGHVLRLVWKINIYKILAGKPTGNGLLRRHRRRRKYNIRMNLREVVLEYMDWIHVAEGRLALVSTETWVSVRGEEFVAWM
jgi:hypothetical protein